MIIKIFMSFINFDYFEIHYELSDVETFSYNYYAIL